MPRLAFVLLLSLLCIACGGNGTPSGEVAPRGGTIVLGSTTDVDSWNEYLSHQAFAVSLHRRISLRLAQETAGSAERPPGFEPLLAESWEFSPDRKTLSFRLREATWSDGRPVTSADVRFTWKAQTAPSVAWIGAETKRHIVDVDASDSRTAVFRFDRAYPEQLADAVDGGILPEHVFAAVPFESWRTHDWSGTRVGSGPFLPESHRPGEEIVLVRNPRYFRGGLPRTDRLVVRIVPDSGALLTQFLAGGLDWLEGVSPEDGDRVRGARGARLFALDTPGFDYVGWNGARPPFDDRQIRRALSLAVDVEALVAELLHGFGRVSVGPLPSSGWLADPSAAPLPHDPEEARRILAAKGYGPDRPLAFEIVTNAGNRLREGVLVKLQDQWARVGVRATPRTLEMRTLRERSTRGDYDAYLAGWRFAGKIDLASIFGSSAFPPAGSNVVRYRSSAVDESLRRLAGAEGWDEARALYHEVQRLVREDHPYTFLYEPQRLVAVGPALVDVTIDVPSDPLARIERAGVSR